MLRKFAVVTALAVATLSSIIGNSVKAEVLVPLQQYLDTTTRKYEANQYKTSYTIYVPQLSLSGTTININPNVIGEPVKLPIINKNGMEYIDLDQTTPMIGVTYTKQNDYIQVLPAPQTMEVLNNKPVQGPLAWAFDPWSNEGTPYEEKLNTSGDNIISPSWFKLHSLGLESSPNINADYVKAYKDKGYHVWPLITNRFDPGFTSGILANEAVWKKYSNNLIQYAYIYGFDGYNFDFENVDYADRERLTKFVAYLADELHKYNIQSSIDVTGYSNSPEWSLVYNRKAFSESVDYVILMAYDETWAKSTKAGPVASYPWVRDHTEKMIQEVPSHKLVLGIPFYMRLWHETNNIARGETLAMKNTSHYFTNYADKITWDDQLKLHYLTIPTANGNDRIWFEDNTSLALKLKLVKELQLGGFAAWRKGFEDKSTISMIQSTDLGKGIPKTPYATVEESNHESVLNKSMTKAERKALEKAEKERIKSEKVRIKAEQAEAKRKAKAEAAEAKRKAKAEAAEAKRTAKLAVELAKRKAKADAEAAKQNAKAKKKAIKKNQNNSNEQNNATNDMDDLETIPNIQVVKK